MRFVIIFPFMFLLTFIFSDCLRANKSTMAWGVEVRVPFLDKEFLDVAMTLDPNVCDTHFSPLFKHKTIIFTQPQCIHLHFTH